jgi:hypothetical protein
MDLTAADQFCQLIARLHAASPEIRMLVNAHLVKLRSIDAVKPVGDAGDLQAISVPHDRVGGPTRARR